jgi:mannosyltransferase
MGLVVGIAVAASLGLLPWIGASMFADEGATLYSARLSWSNLWAQSLHVDLVLLPYYFVIHFWLMASETIQWVRAFSLLAYCGTIVVVGWMGLRIAGRWCGVITAFLTAASTLLVEKSLNARPYEASTLLVAMCAVFLFNWLHDSRERWLWAFSISALLATAMQLFASLAPVSMLVCVLLVRPHLIGQRLRALLAPIAILAIASGAWVIACAREVGQVNWIAGQSAESRMVDELRGPAIGQFYDLVLFFIVALVVFKLATIWTRDVRDAVAEQISRDRDILALTIGWAIVPTVALAIASFVHPIYSVRYVAASAPGVALLVAFVCVRAFPKVLDPSRVSDRTVQTRLRNPLTAVVGVATTVLLVISYGGSAAIQQEDLQGPARYAARHAQSGDAIALPDHAITAAVDYYLAKDKRPIPLWTQLGTRQRYVEGFDLSLHPSGCDPGRVWFLDDGTVPGDTRFVRALEEDGYAFQDYQKFNGAALFVFHSTTTTKVFFPSSGATLSGKGAVLGASASSSSVRITQLQFVISGRSFSKLLIGRAAILGSYGSYFFWNTTSVPNGTYSLQSVVTTPGGQNSCSTPISVEVRN